MKATPEIVTSDMRSLMLEAHDEILRQRDEIARISSDNLKLKLMLSCVLPIADKCAYGSVEARTVQYIRSALGERPLTGKPTLAVDNQRDAS